jgi:hypothetical protein
MGTQRLINNTQLMKKATCIVFALLLWSAQGIGQKPQADNVLTGQQKADGWQMLFDGKTLKGWSAKSGYATYKVDHGAIVGTTQKGSPNTFLCSDREFADFELTFDVKFDGEFFNSGVQIRSKLRGNEYGGRVFGPQVEIATSPDYAGYVYGEAAGGWQSPEPKSDEERKYAHNHFQNEGWNHYRIVAVGRRIQTWINGNLVADLMYNQGRYMDNSEGFIGLQVHSVPRDSKPMSVRWKNIYIKPIQNSQLDHGGAGYLCNGEDFGGWKFHLGKEGDDHQEAYTVRNGIISCAGNPRGYMYTEKSFSNYIVKYDWAFQRPADLQVDSLFRGNSGCLIHIGEKNALGIWPLSIEVQGQHRRAGLILPIPRSVKCEHTFDLEAYRKAINPVGKWSTMVIDVKGGEMQIRLNGMVVSTVKDCELTSGPIGWQSEGAPLRWKNIRLIQR